MWKHPKKITSWKAGHTELAHIVQDGHFVTISHIRNSSHIDEHTQNVAYFSETYDLRSLTWCTIYSVPFGIGRLLSHIMIGFEFQGKDPLILSVEARRRPHDTFSIWKGFFPYYGLIYIWGTYKDLIGLRLHTRKDQVFAYITSFSQQEIQNIFLDCTKRTNTLRECPEIFKNLSSNCVTNGLGHVFCGLWLPYPKTDYRLILSGKIEHFLLIKKWVKEKIFLSPNLKNEAKNKGESC